MTNGKLVWSSRWEDQEELHSCFDCGNPTSIEEPLCWNCECGDSSDVPQSVTVHKLESE